MTTTHEHDRTVETEPERRSPTQQTLLTIPEAANVLAVGRTMLYELIATGEIEVIHIGRSARVPADSIRNFVATKRGLGEA